MDELGDRALFMIGIAAELAQVHPQTLRIYERRGLLKPKRSSRNTRLYSQADIARLRRINELTDAGINLAGIIRILELEEAVQEAELRLERAAAETERLLERQREQLDAVRRSFKRELAVIPRAEIEITYLERK